MLNKVILIGRLGRDPEVRYTQDGRAVANFTMATNEVWNDKATGEKRERTEWHRVVAFARLGEICGQYLSRGKLVYVEGRLQTREWEDQQGVKRYTTEIIAQEMKMLEPKGTQQSAYGPAPGYDPYGPGPGTQPFPGQPPAQPPSQPPLQANPAPYAPAPDPMPTPTPQPSSTPSETPGVPPVQDTEDDIPF